MAKNIVITIDGPAASGKGTITKKIASYFEIPYLDTGKLYRAAAYQAILENIDIKNEDLVAYIASNVKAGIIEHDQIATEEVGKVASIISTYEKVRKALFDYQRNFSLQKGGAVLDGRDVGSVIVPECKIKLFITADVEVRAKRRFLQLLELGKKASEEQVLKDLKLRDERDQNRKTAPLIIPEDAYLIDSSEKNIGEVFAEALSYCTQVLS